jgi:hypothetical protein
MVPSSTITGSPAMSDALRSSRSGYASLAVACLLLAVLLHWAFVFPALWLLGMGLHAAKDQPRARRGLQAMVAVVALGMVLGGGYRVGKDLALRDNALAAAACQADCTGDGGSILSTP